MNDNPHKEHRQRLKERFRREGLDNFAEHNVIELLLFFGIPLKDTNEIAHRLLERFGDFTGVFDASFDELCSVEGVSEHTATLIMLMPQFARYYMTKSTEEHKKYDNIAKVGELLVGRYIGVNVETVLLLLFDNSYRLLDVVKIHEGAVNSVTVTPRKLVETALSRGAAMAVVAHNHPHGVAVPSGDDILMTSAISKAFDLVGVTLLEHIIVAGERYTPVMIRSREALRSAPHQIAAFFSGADSDKFYSGK